MYKNKNVQVLNRQTWINYVSAIFLSLLFVVIGIAVSTGLIPHPSTPTAHADPAPAVNVWWPTDNFPMGSTQPFKAMVSGLDVSQYEMFWQVDSGQWNWMDTNNTDYPHKEANVNLSGWTWHGSGPYTVNFIVRQNGNIIAQKSVQLRLNTSEPAPAPVQTATVAPTPAPAPAPILKLAPTVQAATITPTPQPQATPQPQPATVSTNISNTSFYVDPNGAAARQANEWRTSKPTDAAKMDILAAQPTAKWLGGWNGNVESDVKTVMQGANAKNQTAVFAVYNIPGRDCGGFSAGGITADTYPAWIKSIAAGIGGGKALVILEPDSLASIGCLSATEQQTRLNLLSGAIDTLKANSNTKVYLDAGHSGWGNASMIVDNIKKGNLTKADGFFLNASNFRTTADETAYGTGISQQLGGKHFVIDTSRNGLGPQGSEWCNPLGRAIGQKPTVSTGNSLIDAYLWVKTPGESDGPCNGGPNAGAWWPDYAIGLVERAQ